MTRTLREFLATLNRTGPTPAPSATPAPAPAPAAAPSRTDAPPYGLTCWAGAARWMAAPPCGHPDDRVFGPCTCGRANRV